MSAIRCDLCGRFRKASDVLGTGNEYEEWVECIDCMPIRDRGRLIAARTTKNGDNQ